MDETCSHWGGGRGGGGLLTGASFKGVLVTIAIRKIVWPNFVAALILIYDAAAAMASKALGVVKPFCNTLA